MARTDIAALMRLAATDADAAHREYQEMLDRSIDPHSMRDKVHTALTKRLTRNFQFHHIHDYPLFQKTQMTRMRSLMAFGASGSAEQRKETMKTVMESLVAVRDAIPQQDKQPGGPHHDFNQQVSDLLTALREIKAPANADPTKKLSAYARVMARLAQLRQSWGAHSNVEDAYKLIDEALSSMLSPAVPHQNAAAPTPHTRPASQAGIGASSSSPGAQPGISGPLGANSLNGGYLRNPPYHGNPSAPEWQAHRATHETWATVIGSIMQETPPGYSTVPFDQSCFYTLDLADPKPHNTAIHVRIQSESPGLSQSKMAVLQHSFGANGYQSLDLLPSPEGEPEYPREIRDHALKLMVGYVVDRFDTWTVGGSRSVDLRGSDIERATMRKMMEGQLAQRYQGDELKKRVALIKDVTDAPPAPQPASRAWAVRPSKERGLPPILTPPVPA